jgi:hypothetical protein
MIEMPMYYFHLRDGEPVPDVDGTELLNLAEARTHAWGVARELMSKSPGMLDRDWTQWSMFVHDGGGNELFSFRLVDIWSNTAGQ